MLDELRERYSLSVSEPVLIGEDKVGLIFYAEGRVPLFWDSPLLELNNRLKEVPSLIERQPLITGHDGIPENDESEKGFEKPLNNIHLFAEALVHLIR